jgi:hypothetical protein
MVMVVSPFVAVVLPVALSAFDTPQIIIPIITSKQTIVFITDL